MPLLQQPVMQFSDYSGRPLPFARAYFYKHNTTDPVEVFADEDMTIPRTWPVVADDAGMFPAIYFDGNEEIRLKITDQDGDLANPVLDISPVNTLFTVYASNLADGAIEEKLGYTPVDPNNALFTAPARMDFVATELNVDDIGFRGDPVTVKNLDTDLELNDSGRLVVKDDSNSYTWIIPVDMFPIGHWIGLYLDNDSGNVNLNRAAGVTLVEAGANVNNNRVLPPNYKGRISQVSSNKWVLEPPLA